MEQMIPLNNRRRACGGSVPKVRRCLRRRVSAGIEHPHAVLLEGYQRNRRLPHVRGGRSRRAARWQAACVLPGDAEGMVVNTNTPSRAPSAPDALWS